MSAPQPLSPLAAITYRPFTPDDIAAAHALSMQVSWPHRADDWRFVADAGSGFVAESTNGTVGTALCWQYGASGASFTVFNTFQNADTIRWTVVERMVWAWILTIPIAGGLAYGLVLLLKLFGWS